MVPTSAAPSSLSPVWPADVPVPGRLAQLASYVRGSGSPLFGDLELDNLADDFLVAYHGGDYPDLMELLPETRPGAVPVGR